MVELGLEWGAPDSCGRKRGWVESSSLLRDALGSAFREHLRLGCKQITCANQCPAHFCILVPTLLAMSAAPTDALCSGDVG